MAKAIYIALRYVPWIFQLYVIIDSPSKSNLYVVLTVYNIQALSW